MNSMKAQILTATLLTAFSGALSAADPQLLNLVMPDAKVLAGVNVEQAKGTQFGQFILNELQTHDSDMQKLATLTGFDPRRDVRELLVASDGAPNSKTGLAVAKGNFDVAKITALGTLHGVVSELYSGVNILEDPKAREHGIAFPDANTVIAGDTASVKAAIDRLKTPQSLPAAVIVKVNKWSTSQDAWGISTVPPSTLAPVAQERQPQPNAGSLPECAAGRRRSQVRRPGSVQRGSHLRYRAERHDARRRSQITDQPRTNASRHGSYGRGASEICDSDGERKPGQHLGESAGGCLPNHLAIRT